MKKNLTALLLTSSLTFNVSAQLNQTGTIDTSKLINQQEIKSYVVKFKSPSVLSFNEQAKRHYNQSTADQITNHFGIEFDRIYHSAFFGGTLKATAQDIVRIKNHALIDSIIENSFNKISLPPTQDIVFPNISEQSNTQSTNSVLSWGLDRIDQLQMPLDDSYQPQYTGEGVTVYIMDSGVQVDHPDLVGRVAYTKDTYNNTDDAFDCHGHGTHVLGTVGSEKYGVAKDATLVMIRPFKNNCGAGSVESFLAAIDFIKQDAAQKGQPAVVNMSLGYTASGPDLDWFEIAIQDLIDSGVSVVTSAGNDMTDTCNQSPARMDSVITVGATNDMDDQWIFTNNGSCVDILAPGDEIMSTHWKSWTTKMSGTSMASPHVAGAAALLLQENPTLTPSQIKSELINRSVKDIIKTTNGSPNRLLYVGNQYTSCEETSSCPPATCDTDPQLCPVDSILKNGISQVISAAKDAELKFTIEVPENHASLEVIMEQGTGDADLYIKFESEASNFDYDCRSAAFGNDESCFINNPQAGIYHITVIAYSAFESAELTASYIKGDIINPPSEGQLNNGDVLSGLSSNTSLAYFIDVPENKPVSFIMSGGTGDADLYVKFNGEASQSNYDCRPFKNGNEEICELTNVTAGQYSILLNSYQAFSDVSLSVNY